MIQPSTLDFLRDLSQNNTREWFQEQKPRYETALANMVTVADQLQDAMLEVDNIEPREAKKMLFRIYRDVRFSANKAPYKTHFSGSMQRATDALRGGYYFHIMPGGSFQGGGFWAPEKEDLLRIRTAIADDPEPLREIISDPVFVKIFGSLQGETLKTAPKGFDKEHPAIDLIRHKTFIVMRSFTDAEVCSATFVDQLVEGYAAMLPFFDYMSEVLTTDGNGLPLV
ncbi:MAG: DUF2461 domain-containing protein [Bacteroidia bacterium]|nr:DUF2461 domain-containing protein [Bacteroidia bacterium]